MVAHDSTAVLRCQVVDAVDQGDGIEEFRMPMTQVWVRYDDRWVCLAGHAGPSLVLSLLATSGPNRPNRSRPDTQSSDLSESKSIARWDYLCVLRASDKTDKASHGHRTLRGRFR